MNSYFEKIGQEHLEDLAAQMKGMSPVEKVCAKGVVDLATVIAVLINSHNWMDIKSLSASCNDLFTQAAEIERDEKSRRLQ